MADKEIWKELTIDNMNFLVSNKGRIAKLCNLYISHPKDRPENSYLCVNACINKKTTRYLVHRLVAQAFIPNPNNLPIVNHINGVKIDNRAENLEWCTRKQNTAHAIAHGLSHLGEKGALSKFTIKQVEQIRKEYIPYDKNFGSNALSKKYGVDKSTISKIIRNKSYYNPNYNPTIHRLNPEQIKQIRKEHIFGSHKYGASALARKYGVSQTTMWEIINNKTYKNIE